MAILINTAVAVLATVVLIVRFKVNPVISLVIGSVYLGLSAGLGVTKTVETITGGFGEIMVEVGLLTPPVGTTLFISSSIARVGAGAKPRVFAATSAFARSRMAVMLARQSASSLNGRRSSTLPPPLATRRPRPCPGSTSR